MFGFNKTHWSVFFLIVMSFLLAQCSKEIDSHYMQDDVKVDGETIEWQGKFTSYMKKAVSVGIGNDEKNLYVCFVSGNRQLNHSVIRNGFITWINVKGKKKKNFGIKFPRGMDINKMRPMMKNRANENMQNRDEPFGQNQSFPQMRMNQLEIITKDGSTGVVPIHNNAYNLELQLNRERARFVYEIKVPFKAINEISRDSIVVSKDSKIGVGFELCEVERPEKMQRGETPSGGRPSGGGIGGPSGGRGGIGGGPSGRGRPGPNNQQSSTFDVWLKVNLATKQDQMQK